MSAQMLRLHKENMIRMNEPIVSEKLSSVSENLFKIQKAFLYRCRFDVELTGAYTCTENRSSRYM